MKILDLFRNPVHERIEEAARCVALRASDVEYHRLMSAYYSDTRAAVEPYDSVNAAYEFARLFQQQDYHTGERCIAERRLHETKAKLNALRKS